MLDLFSAIRRNNLKYLIIFSLLLTACSINEVHSTKAVAPINEIYYDAPNGCIGSNSNWNTFGVTDDFYNARLCGKVGKVAVHIEAGHMDSYLNGFKRA